MSDIVELDEHRPHISGPVACTRCRHKWTAVRPVGSDLLECPACGAIRGASLDTMLHKPHLILGAECCGQRDSDGVCAAPACLYGNALMLIQCIRDASHLEYAALRAEVERLAEWNREIAVNARELVAENAAHNHAAVKYLVEIDELRAENERLREEIKHSRQEHAISVENLDEDIEQLRGQVEFEKKCRNDAFDELRKQDAEIERLRTALEPLACTCDRPNGAACSRSEVDCPFWNARAALEEKQ
jgi:hypothetical protein